MDITVFQYCFQSQISPLHSDGMVKSLRLHADICDGQNKNRFVLMYLCWQNLVGLNCDFQLQFMVAGNTKNVVKWAFGHLKRNLKSTNSRTPAEMMKIFSINSEITIGLYAPDVAWPLGEVYFETFFKIPQGLKITHYYVFIFTSCDTRVLYAKEFSFSEEEKILQHT